MEFDEVVRRRKSVRSFKKKKASWKDVLEAVDSVLQGPFAGNHSNLNFLIVEDKKKIRELAEVCEQDWISESGILVVVCSDDANLENIYGDRGRIYSKQHSGAAIYAFLLKLVDLGLDGCWVGAYDDDSIREKLKIPSNVEVEAIIPVGFSNDVAKKKIKKKLENVLYWEKWGKDKRPVLFEEEKQDYRG